MSEPDNANKEFEFSYEFDGHKWAGSVWASTREEAEMKLKAMGKGKIDGVLMGTIPATSGPCPECGRWIDD